LGDYSFVFGKNAAPPLTRPQQGEASVLCPLDRPKSLRLSREEPKLQAGNCFIVWPKICVDEPDVTSLKCDAKHVQYKA
jgi:hypothetical protein